MDRIVVRVTGGAVEIEAGPPAGGHRTPPPGHPVAQLRRLRGLWKRDGVGPEPCCPFHDELAALEAAAIDLADAIARAGLDEGVRPGTPARPHPSPA